MINDVFSLFARASLARVRRRYALETWKLSQWKSASAAHVQPEILTVT